MENGTASFSERLFSFHQVMEPRTTHDVIGQSSEMWLTESILVVLFLSTDAARLVTLQQIISWRNLLVLPVKSSSGYF
jgi:hypothetical protein